MADVYITMLDVSSVFHTEAEGAYPIVLASYEIVCSDYPDDEVGKAVKSFMTAAVTIGQERLAEDGYIPVPEEFQEKLLAAISEIS
jgi:phosphate transport system substrate-binding protein